MTLRFCRYCDEPITDPDDAVHLWHEESMSGPGRDVWGTPRARRPRRAGHRAGAHPGPRVDRGVEAVLMQNNPDDTTLPTVTPFLIVHISH